MGVINRLVSGQLRKPSGLFGRLIGSLLSRTNETGARWTVSLLDLRPDARVLEIGFGPGVAVQYAAEKAPNGFVAGIDFSATMVEAARKRNAAAVREGRVDLRQGDVTSLPYPDGSFDIAFTIHCIYFWADPVRCLEEIRRVLRPEGELAVTILPKEKWPKERIPPADLFTLYNEAEVQRLMSDAGFRNVRIEMYPEPDKFGGACVLGVK